MFALGLRVDASDPEGYQLGLCENKAVACLAVSAIRCELFQGKLSLAGQVQNRRRFVDFKSWIHPNRCNPGLILSKPLGFPLLAELAIANCINEPFWGRFMLVLSVGYCQGVLKDCLAEEGSG